MNKIIRFDEKKDKKEDQNRIGMSKYWLQRVSQLILQSFEKTNYNIE